MINRSIARRLFSTALVSTLIGCAFSTGAAAEQQVATGSNFPNALVTSDATTNEVVSRTAVIIGADTNALTFVYENNYISPTTVTNTGNAVSILGACLESTSLNTSVPITFSSSSTATLADAQHMMRSDAVAASAFSLTKFTRGELYYLRIRATVTAGNSFATSIVQTKTPEAGTQPSRYYAAGSRSYDVCGTGKWAGGGASNQSLAPSAIVGTPLADGYPAVMVVGDSWSTGTDDTATTTPAGFGISARGALIDPIDPNNLTDAIAFGRLARGGTKAQILAASANLLDYLQFGNILFAEIGANDIGTGRTPSQVFTDLTTIYTAARNKGVQKIIQAKMNPRTCSTDQWATAANQSFYGDPGCTSNPNFGPGTNAEALNTLIAGAYPATIDSILMETSIRDPNNEWKWVSNGTAFYATNAGNHPNQNTYPLLGSEYRAAVLALTVH